MGLPGVDAPKEREIDMDNTMDCRQCTEYAESELGVTEKHLHSALRDLVSAGKYGDASVLVDLMIKLCLI